MTLPHLAQTLDATARYLASVARLDDDAVRRPSLLPGWSGAHVVAHVSRNADGFTRLLQWATTGEVAHQYPSQADRDAGIEAGAHQPAAALLREAEDSAGRWERAARALPEDRLAFAVARVPGADSWPVRRVGISRRTEVEVHHADLDVGYTAADWPPDLVAHLMQRRERELSAVGTGLRWRATDTGEEWSSGDGPVVAGTAADLVWWLLGRGTGTGTGLTCSEPRLPDLGRWA